MRACGSWWNAATSIAPRPWKSRRTPRPSKWRSRASKLPSRVSCKLPGETPVMDQRSRMEDCRLQIADCRYPSKPLNLQSAICNLKLLFVAVLALSTPGLAVAVSDDASFPRGDGFYFNSLKLLTLAAAYLCWVATCRWVEQDASDLDLPVTQWSTMLFGAGFVGLVIVWLLPWYWISFLLLLILYASAGLAYVNLRNQKVSAELRVLTTGHIQDLLEKYLRIRLGRGGEDRKSSVT